MSYRAVPLGLMPAVGLPDKIGMGVGHIARPSLTMSNPSISYKAAGNRGL